MPSIIPLSGSNLEPAPLAAGGRRGLPALAAGGRAGRGSALKWLVITGTAGSGGSVHRLPNAPALSGAALALREMACE